MESTEKSGRSEMSRGRRECESMKGTNSERKAEVQSSKVEGILEMRCCQIQSAEVEESKRVSASRQVGKSPSFIAM
jgi:hypothetical protein